MGQSSTELVPPGGAGRIRDVHLEQAEREAVLLSPR